MTTKQAIIDYIENHPFQCVGLAISIFLGTIAGTYHFVNVNLVLPKMDTIKGLEVDILGLERDLDKINGLENECREKLKNSESVIQNLSKKETNLNDRTESQPIEGRSESGKKKTIIKTWP